MNMTKLFLILNMVIFFVFGAICLVNPQALLSGVGTVISGGDLLYEMRGIYGGVSLGAATLCLLGVLRADMARPALIFLLTYTGGYVFARIVGVGFDGLPQPVFYIFIAFEAFTAIAAFLLLRKARQA